MAFTYKEDIDKARERVEAWWNGAVLDRGIVQAPAPREPGMQASPFVDTSTWSQTRLREYFTDPAVVIPRLTDGLRRTYFGGESFPVMFPVSIGMVAITANYLGCPMRFVNTETTWHDPVINDWEHAPALDHDPRNEWWRVSRGLLESAARASDGYFIGCPDLNGPTEILGLLRGTEKYALDFYDNPERIKPALARINKAWYAYWRECSAITQRTGGYFHWMGFWSAKPSTDVQSDFSCMLSCSQFDEFFLPFIEEQTRMVERTMYHLDGPGAIHHVDSLLSLPKLTGIQWIQGAGGGSVLKYIPLLKKIQDAGKLLSLFCDKEELEPVCQELRPEGLFPVVTGCSSPEEAEQAVRVVARLGARTLHASTLPPSAKEPPMPAHPFMNPDLPVDARVTDLLGRMSLEEKVSQMVNNAAAIPRLGIPAYNWWNECLHGVGRAGVATVFPQAIGMAASFDSELLHAVAGVIADEARAKHHESARRGDRRIYKGLTYWTPNVNIFRDPRWGRGQETYGEDPYLAGRMGVAFVTGLQGSDPRYLKLVATPKHYAVHSGPEALRHHFDARVSAKDLRETYLPAFRDCIVEGKAHSIMGAYNRTNGEPCCASTTLLEAILRGEWGFQGYVVSDCGAIADIHAHHTVTRTPAQSAARAVKAGCDLECGMVYPSLVEAVRQGLITEADIDLSLGRLLRARFLLGMFDPPERVPYAAIPYEVNDSPTHGALALAMARESIVLLKNQDGFLPLAARAARVAVIGPSADNREVLLGSYNGTASRPVTLLEGVRHAAPAGVQVRYARGCDFTKGNDSPWGDKPDDGFAEAVSAAAGADVAIVCLGLNPVMEGEEDPANPSEWKGDRTELGLPGLQQQLLEAVAATGTPVVLVLTGGSPLAVTWAAEHVPAILMSWYPGQAGGTAVGEALFGAYSPSGKLPVTFVTSSDQLPPFVDYSMEGRTYRFIREEPLYPFGFGLGYSAFRYERLELSRKSVEAGDSLTVKVSVKNTGTMRADETVQAYLTDVDASTRVPRWQLAAFSRVRLEPGASADVSFSLGPRQMSLVNDDGERALEPGVFTVHVGGSQPDQRSVSLLGVRPLKADFEVTGKALKLAP